MPVVNGVFQSAAPQYQRPVHAPIMGTAAGPSNMPQQQTGGSWINNPFGATWNPNGAPTAAPQGIPFPGVNPVAQANQPNTPVPTPQQPAMPPVRNPGYLQNLMQGHFGNVNFGIGGGVVGGGPTTRR